MNLGDPADLGLAHVPALLLAALSRTSSPLTIRQLARVSGVSLARTQHWVNHWADRGLVNQQRAGRAVMCSVNREHLFTPSLLALANAREIVVERIATEVASWRIPALTVTAFGSFARGDGSVASDIDLLVVHDAVDEEAWSQQLARSAETLELNLGNTIQWLDFPRPMWVNMRAQDEPLVAQVHRDAIHIFGEHLTLVVD